MIEIEIGWRLFTVSAILILVLSGIDNRGNKHGK
jgi:hypothetical protein